MVCSKDYYLGIKNCIEKLGCLGKLEVIGIWGGR